MEINIDNIRHGQLKNAAKEGVTLLKLDCAYYVKETLFDDEWKEQDYTRYCLNEIPLEVFELRSIKTLISTKGEIESLPSSIKNLSDLEELNLSDNKISYLPNEIGELKKLKNIDLRNNQLKSLPESLRRLTSLRTLDLRGNPLPDIPPEVLERVDQPDVILRSYFARGKKPLNEVKLILVGQGSVGKTSLVKRILFDTYDPHQNKTDGIAITRWRVKNTSAIGKHQEDISVNLWDFGGQEIMHATHQFFLTKRSLYLLAIDARLTQEENRIEYWLKIVQSFSDSSPVLIIGNKVDQHRMDIDRTGLQKKYPNIVGFFETSAATGEGIEDVKASITEQINQLPHIRDLVIENWLQVKKLLEERREQTNFINYDEYVKLCIKSKVLRESFQLALLSILHDLGIILYFQGDLQLSELGILNPEWVTNGVYKILNSPTLFQNKGVLQLSMLDEILNTPEYPWNKRLFLLKMMKKFELCYGIEADKTFLIPDLLPKDEPITDGRDKALAFQYHYAILPSSVITKFIVRMNESIHEKVWRSGVVLKEGCNTAVVKADIEDRKVFIWVSGDEYKRLDFLSKIRGQFDAIHKTISKLEVKEMIPVPGHPEAEPIDYDLLLQMDHNNVEVYPVLSGGKMIVVNVREMLSGVARQEDRQRGNFTYIHINGDVKDSTIISGNGNEVIK